MGASVHHLLHVHIDQRVCLIKSEFEAEKLKAKLGLGEDGEASEVYTTALELIKESIGEEEYSRRLSAFMEEPPSE